MQNLPLEKIAVYTRDFSMTPLNVRKRKAEKITETMASEAKEGLEELLWNTLTAFEGYPFRTAEVLRDNRS